jgi:hypothetical protein
MSEPEHEKFALAAWRIEKYHRGLKRQCLIEPAQRRRLPPVLNHIGLCIRVFLRLESHCYQENGLDGSKNHDYSRGGARIFIKPALFASPNCVSHKGIKLPKRIF